LAQQVFTANKNVNSPLSTCCVTELPLQRAFHLVNFLFTWRCCQHLTVHSCKWWDELGRIWERKYLD